jgi:hypothetical protein
MRVELYATADAESTRDEQVRASAHFREHDFVRHVVVIASRNAGPEITLEHHLQLAVWRWAAAYSPGGGWGGKGN